MCVVIVMILKGGVKDLMDTYLFCVLILFCNYHHCYELYHHHHHHHYYCYYYCYYNYCYNLICKNSTSIPPNLLTDQLNCPHCERGVQNEERLRPQEDLRSHHPGHRQSKHFHCSGQGQFVTLSYSSRYVEDLK